jgi:hypothetical protein
VLLLDDEQLRLKKSSRSPSPARLSGVRAALFHGPLALGLLLSMVYLLPYLGAGERAAWSDEMNRNLRIVKHLRLGSDYSLYRFYGSTRTELRIQGSNDGGKTWRRYPMRLQPNSDFEMSPFVAPYFARFDASLATAEPAESALNRLADGLLSGNPEIVALFAANPFPDGPPTRIAFPLYEGRFAPLDEHRRTGRFWVHRYVRDLIPERRR